MQLRVWEKDRLSILWCARESEGWEEAPEFDENLWEGSSNKKATAEARPKGVGEEGTEEIQEAGVGHMLVISDPERKEEVWTVTRRISWAKGKRHFTCIGESWSCWKVGRKMLREEKKMKELWEGNNHWSRVLDEAKESKQEKKRKDSDGLIQCFKII